MKNKILLIDDEKDVCDIVKIDLETTFGYQVVTAYSGQEALLKFGQEKFDLVISDYHMPEMDGVAIVKALKKMKPEIPVIMLTIYYDDDTVVDKLTPYADAIASKPIDYDKLHATIQSCLLKDE